MTQLPSVMELMVNNPNKESHFQPLTQLNQQASVNKRSSTGQIILPPLSKHLTDPVGDNYSLNKRISISSSINANSRNPSASNESPNNSVGPNHASTLISNTKPPVVTLGSPIDNNLASQKKSNSTSNIPTVSSIDENSAFQVTPVVTLAKSPSVSPKQSSSVSPQVVKLNSSPKTINGSDYFQYQAASQVYQHPPNTGQFYAQAQYYHPHQVPPGPASAGQPMKNYFEYANFNPAVHYASQLTPGLTPGLAPGLSPSVNGYPYAPPTATLNPSTAPPAPPQSQHQHHHQHQHHQLHQSIPQQDQQHSNPNPHQTPRQQHMTSPQMQAQLSPGQTVKRPPHSIPLSPQNFVPGHYPIPPHLANMTPGLTPGIPPQGMAQVMPQVMTPQPQVPYPPHMPTNMPTNMPPHTMHGMPQQIPMMHGVPMMNIPPGSIPMGMGMNVPMWYEDNHALLHKRRIIKRRTRTGCLTCRKRRIKCDERKPYCFNCERSRKVCLGYENLNKKKEKDSDNDDNDLDQDGEVDQENDQDIDHDIDQEDNEKSEEDLLPNKQ